MFSRSFEEHIDYLRIVLERMRAAGLRVHHGKTQLATHSINLLGFVIEKGHLRPIPDKLQAVLQYPPPRAVKALQRFLGMLAFYRLFIL